MSATRTRRTKVEEPPAGPDPDADDADPSSDPPEPDSPAEPEQIEVYAIAPGPVHVGDGVPLTRPDTRFVSTSPLVRALIDSGQIGQVGMKEKT